MRFPRRPPRRLSGTLIALAALLASPAWAGSICGTVRDGLTAQPVPRAGVFLFQTGGAYTGLYAATDSAGAFCIDAVPAGTYHLQVRVNDYLAAVVRNVVVAEDQTGVRIDTEPPPRLHLAAPWPNPSRSQVTLRLSSQAPGFLELLVLDVQGRVVRAWAATGDGGERTIVWDFRDLDGNRVPPGIYFVRLTDGREVASQRVTFLP